MSCLGIMLNDSSCPNPRHQKYGEYCGLCWKKGNRNICSAINLKTGKKCPNKVKIGKYCGNHQDFETPRCIWVTNEGKICTYFQKIDKYCNDHYNAKINKDKKIENKNTSKNKLKQEDLKTYSKEEYKNVNYLNQIFACLKYRQNLIDGIVNDEKKDRLLIINNLELIKEWDFNKNKEVDILKTTCGLNKKVWWKCLNEEHESYKASIHLRAGGSICKECRLESIGKGKEKRKQMEEKIKEHHSTENIDPTAVGDETENYIVNLLNETDSFKSVVKIGNIAGKADVEIVLQDDSIRYIQVKTLTRFKNKINQYTINLKNYQDNMLLVCVNKERDNFVLTYASKFKNMKKVSLPFNAKNSKYKDIMYEDLDDFKNELIELIPNSCSENIIYTTINKEISSLQRLEDFCKNNNLIYKRNETNGNAIDGYINGYRFQAKFRSENHGYFFKIDIKKCAGVDNGKRLKSAYEEKDFDFLIVEVGGKKENKKQYLNNFCIIPMKSLVEKGLVRSGECTGKITVNISFPDYEKDYWTNEYWNDISLLI